MHSIDFSALQPLLTPALLVIVLISLYLKDFGILIRVVGFCSINSIAIFALIFFHFASMRMVNDLFPLVARRAGIQGPQYTESDVIAFYETVAGGNAPLVFAWNFVAILGMFLSGILIGKHFQSENRGTGRSC